ncbi:MAG TPA: glycerophosphodiester phosphodiesterase family protein, partial [Sumerlaeia bacterium]|nr:glycerophosphodiester phosphodiesterase family protein [Sumerlaeia bacterium]
MELVAHRGASHDAPENTLASVNLGWERGADGVEVDVYLSKDGRVVAIHDGSTKRTAGFDKAVRDQTLAELKTLDAGSWKAEKWKGERIPTLAEVLDTIPEGRYMLVEVKCGPEIAPEMVRVVRNSGKKTNQIRFISFSLEVCAELKKALPAHKVHYISGFGHDKETDVWTPTAEELIQRALGAGLDGLDLNAADPVDAAFVRKVRKAGLEMHVW